MLAFRLAVYVFQEFSTTTTTMAKQLTINVFLMIRSMASRVLLPSPSHQRFLYFFVNCTFEQSNRAKSAFFLVPCLMILPASSSQLVHFEAEAKTAFRLFQTANGNSRKMPMHYAIESREARLGLQLYA
jgi:hypothetical protein